MSDSSRYDVASMRATAAQIAELFKGLVAEGMSRKEALTVVCTWVTAIVHRAQDL